MKILIDITHPAHVHLFKNFIWEMQKSGSEFKITTRDKEMTKQLLDAYGIPYEIISVKQNKKLSLFKEWVIRGFKIYKIAKEFNPDCLMGTLNPIISFLGFTLKKTSLLL